MSDSGDDVKLTVPYLLVLANTSVLSDHGVSWLMSWHARAELPCQTLSLDAFQPVLVCQVSPGDHITKRSLILCNATGSMHRNDSFYSSLTSNHVVQSVTSEEGRLHTCTHRTMMTSLRSIVFCLAYATCCWDGGVLEVG
jgi:hypothetical protein